MPIFISYSHSDKDFVDELAASIVKERNNVWVDRWELNVGDSIVQKAQDALTTASALLVVLSKASVTSEWCKKELAVGLTRELKEKRVIVLPVLLEDCDIPMFLQDKKYADFRKNFGAGLKDVLEAIAAVSNRDQSRIDDPNYVVDWAEDWWFESGSLQIRFTIIEASKNLPLSVLTEITVSCNEAATRRYNEFAAIGLDWIGRAIVGEVLFDLGDQENIKLVLADQSPRSFRIAIGDKLGRPVGYNVLIISRRLGADTGRVQVVFVSNYLQQLRGYQRSVSRKLSSDEVQSINKIIAAPP